jgi:hypothetical protein
LKKTLDFAVKFRYRSIEGLAPRIDDDGPLWAQLIQLEANRLPDPSLDTVAHHGFTKGAGARKADVRSLCQRFADTECRKQGPAEAGTLVINPAEVFGTQQTDTFRETRDGDYLSELTVSFLRPRARRRARTARPFLVSIRERNPCVFARWRLFG